MAQPSPLEKIGPYAYGFNQSISHSASVAELVQR